MRPRATHEGNKSHNPSLQADNSYIFHSPGNAIFPRKKEPKIFEFENVMERGMRKIFIFVEL